MDENASFLCFLCEQSTKCSQQAVKCLIISSLYMSSIKNFQFVTFFDSFYILVNTQLKIAFKKAAILNDVTGPPAALRAIICTSSCRAYHRLFNKGEIFSKYWGPSTQPPLYHGGDAALLVHPRVNEYTWSN